MAYTLKQALGYVQCRLYFLGEMRRKKEIGVVSASTSKVFRKDDPVHITAHRGFSGIAPENSLPAFECACEHDYYAIECDVHLTKDGQWIICHNSTIDKTCNAKGNISDYTLEELRNFRITYGHGIEKYEDLKLPTLDEYLDLCAKYNCIINQIGKKYRNECSEVQCLSGTIHQKSICCAACKNKCKQHIDYNGSNLVSHARKHPF